MNRIFGFASVASLCLAACSSSSSGPESSRGGAGGAATAGAAGSTGVSGSATSGGSTGASGSGNGVAGSGSAGMGGLSAGSAGASTGGAPGTAGSTGSAGAAGTGTSSGCTGMALCDDFEADAAGATPTGWTLFNGFGCSGANGSTTPKYPAVVDTTQFHSGSKSVKITGGDSCGPLLVNTAAFANLSGGEVYGRFFVRMPSVTPFDHTVMMALGLKAGVDVSGSFSQDDNLALAPEEIGSMNALVWQTNDSNILPAKAPAAASQTTFPTADTWTCVEFHVSANTNAIETWVDGTVVPGMTFIPGTTTVNQEVNGQWKPAAITPTAFGLGWIVFSGPSISLWFDDAALGTKRIGCN